MQYKLILTEIKNAVNSHSLIYLSVNDKNLQPLTPPHLIIGIANAKFSTNIIEPLKLQYIYLFMQSKAMFF